MIQLTDICKIYKNSENNLPALDHVSLNVEKGEMVAIMGPSGSGKTTLLNMIGCMDRMDSGTYEYDGKAVHLLKGRALDDFRRDHIAFIFQNFAILKDYTVFENVELPLRAIGMPAKKRREQVMGILEKVGLADYAKKLPTKLSGGQQQRCAIARALVGHASLILADEPTGALDTATGQEIMNLLLELKQEGITIIIVTHDPKIAAQADRTVYIRDGKIMQS